LLLQHRADGAGAGLVLNIFRGSFGWGMVAATLVMVVAYIWFTRGGDRLARGARPRMNDLDTGAVAHAVDSLLNFETVKYFGAEAREAKR
jgi:ATP-binding cassette subfamily B protein